MSVIVEFTLPTDSFVFGTALETAEDMEISLEEIVPTVDGAMPYFWAAGTDFETFERQVLDDSNVDAIIQLDRVGDDALYRVTWTSTEDDLLDGLVEAEAVVLEAYSNGAWHFRVRFPDHDLLGQFYNFCTDHDITIHVLRVYTLTEASRAGRSFDLTPEQREALLLAVRLGYFAVPRESDLTEIAEELGISQQATSKRVRRGVDKVLTKALLAPGERR